METVNIFLDDTSCKEVLYPFTQIRNTADFKVGIFSVKERWQKYAPSLIISEENTGDCVVMPANIIPTSGNIDMVLNAARQKVSFVDDTLVPVLNHPSDVFHIFRELLVEDIFFHLANSSDGEAQSWIEIEPMVFAHPSAKIKNALFDTRSGPILIDKEVSIGIGAMLAGPIYIGEKTVVKMGATLYGPLSIGKHCVIGGEVSNCIFYSYSNKGHHGYIGTSIIGSWCNIGAGSSCSNVKNTAGKVAYQLPNESCYHTNSIKGGLLMGDYSRCAVNTSFNTAAVVGLSCNIFGNVSDKKYFKNFTWGNEIYELNKAIEHLENWKRMKGEQLVENEIESIKNLYNSES